MFVDQSIIASRTDGEGVSSAAVVRSEPEPEQRRRHCKGKVMGRRSRRIAAKWKRVCVSEDLECTALMMSTNVHFKQHYIMHNLALKLFYTNSHKFLT